MSIETPPLHDHLVRHIVVDVPYLQPVSADCSQYNVMTADDKDIDHSLITREQLGYFGH